MSSLRILISGSSGLVGSALIPLLESQGHKISRLVRSKAPAYPNEIHWDPSGDEIDQTALENFDAIIHLAGENIAQRWTAASMKRIRDSRVQGTKVLCEALARCNSRPKTLISASAIGFYGNRGDELCTELSASGEGFLASVCRDWEAATEPAKKAGIRVVTPRLGIVISKNGGALKKMLLPFSLGLGGKLGSGRQYMSWIDIEDLIRLISVLLTDKNFQGPVNAVAPGAVTNLEFTKTLGKVLCRPTLFSVPAFALRLLFGKMADEALLGGAKVLPSELNGKFDFGFPTLNSSLKHQLG
jgi:uncharacterized protein (TIGR01777 family)